MKDYIGIDLGTTNSIVSYVNESGKYETIKIGKNKIIPSAIFFDSEDKLYFGKDALRRMTTNPKSGIIEFKRMLKNPSEKKRIYYKNVNKSGENNENIEKIYLIDTNIFINSPNILDRLKQNEKAILSYTVIDELKYRKDYLNTKYQADSAIANIYKHNNIDKSKKIEFVESDLSVIPNGLFKENLTNNNLNDNKILSIAIIKKNKGEDVILITNDKELRIKAENFGIRNINFEEFSINHKILENIEYIDISGKEASTIFLNYLRQEVSKKIKCDIKKAVITVPANFNQIEIELTRNAGLDAGFEDIRILKEPIAAAMVYGLDIEVEKNILIYDFGGGTFDISIIKVNQNCGMEVIFTDGDSKLGGTDITNRIVEYIYEKLEEEHGLLMFSLEESELEKEQYDYNKQKILEKAEQLKIALSEFKEQQMSLINIFITKEKQTTIEYNFTREEIEEEILKSVNSKVIQIVKNSIENAKLKVDDIDIVALAGGSSLIPLFQEGVYKALGKLAKSNNDLDTIVSNGAAIMAENIWGEGIEGIIIDKTVHDFGVKLSDFTFDKIIGHGEKLPVTATKKYRPKNEDQRSISIEAFIRKPFIESYKTFHEGIEFLDKILITGLPTNRDNTKLIVEIKFTINTEYILDLDVTLCEESGEILQCEGLKIIKSSYLV